MHDIFEVTEKARRARARGEWDALGELFEIAMGTDLENPEDLESLLPEWLWHQAALFERAGKQAMAAAALAGAAATQHQLVEEFGDGDGAASQAALLETIVRDLSSPKVPSPGPKGDARFAFLRDFAQWCFDIDAASWMIAPVALRAAVAELVARFPDLEASVCFIVGKSQDDRELLRRVTELAPDSHEAWIEYACGAADAGDYAAAAAGVRRALGLLHRGAAPGFVALDIHRLVTSFYSRWSARDRIESIIQDLASDYDEVDARALEAEVRMLFPLS